MNLLDMRTVLLSYVISSAICAAVMASLWSQNRRRSPELGFWMADFIMQFTGLLLIALRGLLPDFISMVLGNTLILGGALLMYIGLERYTGKTGPQWPNYLYLAAFVCAHTYFVFIQPSLPARNINVSLGLLVMCAQCAWLLLRRVEPAMRPNTQMVGVVFGIFGLVSLARIFLDLAAPPGNDFFQSDLSDTLAVLTYQMLYISLTFALFLMVNRRLFTALESDIRERQRAEAALKISEEKFSVAFQNIPDALVITILPDGKIIEANESFFRMAGFSKEDSLGRTTVELNLWGNLAHRNQLVEALQKQRRVQNLETEFRKKSGELFTGWISSELIQLQGQTCVLNVIHDVSERKRAEDEIQRLARFPAENPNPVLRMDQTGRILYANPASAPLLTTWGREAGQDLPDDWRRQITAVFETGQSTEVEMDCQGRVFACGLTPIPSGGYVNFYGQDITERKRAETALRESEKRLNLAQQSSNAGWWDWDMATGQLAWARELFGLFGLDPEIDQATFEAWDRVMHPDDKASAYERLDLAVKNETYLDNEYRIIQPGGQIKWIRAMGRASYDTEHKPVRMAGICIDITERKRAEEKLAASEVRYRRLFEAAKDGILILDAETGLITDVNPFLSEMLGVAQEEICGKELWELGFFKDIAANKANFLELQRKEYIRYEDLPLETADGRRFHVEFISNVYQVNHHKIVQCNIRDITERKQIEEKITQYADHLEEMVGERTRELRAAQAQLVRRERLATLGQLAGSIGHELRNPLGVIANAIYYLKLIQPEAGAEVREYLGLVEQETRTADKIITDLLGFARTGAADREAVSIPKLLSQTLERYPVAPPVEVTLELPADLPPVYADPQQMMQVLGNLTANACQAMPDGGKLTFSATLQAGRLAIKVQDTGVGIPPEDMDKLFEPLFTTKTKGIGLGLAVSRKLAEANGGRIEVQSEPGKGSTFTLYLPVDRKEP